MNNIKYLCIAITDQMFYQQNFYPNVTEIDFFQITFVIFKQIKSLKSMKSLEFEIPKKFKTTLNKEDNELVDCRNR